MQTGPEQTQTHTTAASATAPTLVSVLGFIIAVMELTGPKYRAVIGCLYQMLYSFGVMLLPVMAYFVRDYTGMLLCMAAPAASALFLGV